MKTKFNFIGYPCVESLRMIWLMAFLLVGFLMTASLAMAHDKDKDRRSSACADTSKAALTACTSSATSDYWLGIGACDNLSDRREKQDCLDETQNSLDEDFATCNDQFQARQEVCQDLGRGPYDPDFSPEKFVSNPTGNDFFPLNLGSKYTYKSDSQRIEVEVGDTTTVKGVQCRVVTDKVYDNAGRLVEDTIDWYAQDKKGNVWYFGETTIAFTFDDDGNPIASTEGSWITGVDEAKPGIIMYADPGGHKGLLYRQEFLLGTAEDLGRVVGINESVTAGGVNYTGCVHTQDSSPLEPGVIEDKYYAKDVGLVLTIDPDGTREVLQP
jgi:hypothetical protein